MQNIATKNTGDSYTSAEFNSSNNELKNTVQDSGQALSGADDFQISKASAVNASGADYYDSSGPADAYVLTKPGTVSLRSPEAYFEGMRIRFRPNATNTGASTVNVAAIGVVSVLKADGVSALSPGDLSTDNDAECRYDITAGAFLLQAPAPEATKTSKGVVFLGDQRIILSNNSVDPVNDIDFSGGRFTFDDGTGQETSPTLTKQLDGTWVQGDNQGGRDPASPLVATGYYFVYAIYNPTNGLSDYVFTDSLGVVTVPGYTKKRYIGAVLRFASAIIPFFQVNKYFYLNPDLVLVPSFTITASAVPQLVGSPLGLQTIAMLNVSCAFTNPATAENGVVRIFTPGSSDPTPTRNNSQLGIQRGAGNFDNIGQTSVEVLTDLNSTVNFRGELLTSPGTFPSAGNQQSQFGLRGWIDINLED